MTAEEIMEAIAETTAFYPLKLKIEFLDRLKHLITVRSEDIQKRIDDGDSLSDT